MRIIRDGVGGVWGLLDAGFMGYWVLLAGCFGGCEISCALSFFS